MAEDKKTRRNVAIKKIVNVVGPDVEPVDTKRVLREIKILRHFRHENVSDKCALRVVTSLSEGTESQFNGY